MATVGNILYELTRAKTENGLRLFGFGASIPADTTAGWAKAAVFFTGTVAGGGTYVNNGTGASSSFRSITTS